MTTRKRLQSIIFVLGLTFGSIGMAQTTTIDHGNGDKTTVTSSKEGSTIERGGAKESTREAHSDAVKRVLKESKDRGEKATIILPQ